MKANTHPKWYPDALVTCACGNTFTVGSTQPQLAVEVCSKCHPFYTGEMKYVDTMGRVEKFSEKRQQAQDVKAKLTKKRKKKAKQKKEQEREPKTLKEMLQAIR